MDATGIRDRVAALSAAQRAILAERLANGAGAYAGARLVAFLERRAPDPAHTELRAFLRQSLPQHMVPAAFVFLDRLPRTPGGKLDVRALPAEDEAAPVTAPSFVAPASAVERQLSDIWSSVLGGIRVGVHDNFFEIGGDSILSIQVVALAGRAGIRLAPDQIFLHQTIAELAQVAGTARPTIVDLGPADGAVPLTPIQHWFREQPLARPEHWHHVLWTEATGGVDADLLARALVRLIEHHDALRLRFAPDGDGRQWYGEAGSVPVRVVDFTDVADPDLARSLAEAADAVAAETDLAEGPLVAALIVARGDEPRRVALVIHHLMVDPLSWRILLEDLDVVYPALEAGADPVLPARTTSFRAWSEALGAYAASDRIAGEREHWLRQSTDPVELPRDLAGEFTEATARTVGTSLDARRTRAFFDEVPGVYGTHADEVLLTALVRAFAPWTGAARLSVGIERHGREPIAEGIDLARTVGWFTSFFPVSLSIHDAAGPGAAIRAIKEQVRAVPGRGVGYGVLRYLSPESDVRAALHRADPPVILNYAGRGAFDAGPATRFRPVGPPVASRDPANGRSSVLEVSAFVRDGTLRIDWTYGSDVHRAATIDVLATRFLKELRVLIDHCAQPDAGGFTPSDFPEAGLSQIELDRFLTGLGS